MKDSRQSRSRRPRQSVLIVEDDPVASRILAEIVSSTGLPVECCECANSALKVNLDAIGAAILDLQLPDGNGLDLLAAIRRKKSQLPCLVVTVEKDVAKAVAAMRSGAVDYLVKPVDPRVLVETLTRAMAESSGSAIEIPTLPWSTEIMQHVQRRTALARQSSTNVLISGPRGSGKARVARWIAMGPTPAINLEGTDDHEVVLSLFGEPANPALFSKKPGLLINKATRTLILESIENIGPVCQRILLKHIKENTNSGEEGVQIISTTHLPPDQLTGSPLFEELVNHLSPFEIHLPALAEVTDDIKVWANLIVGELSFFHGRKHRTLSDAAQQWLLDQSWPGNLPQLRKVLSGAIAGTENLLIGSEELIAQRQDPPLPEETTRNHPIDDLNIRNNERTALTQALKSARGNRKKAAELLGVSLRNIYYMIKRYGIEET